MSTDRFSPLPLLPNQGNRMTEVFENAQFAEVNLFQKNAKPAPTPLERLSEARVSEERNALIGEYVFLLERIDKFLADQKVSAVSQLEKQRAEAYGKCRAAENHLNELTNAIGIVQGQRRVIQMENREIEMLVDAAETLRPRSQFPTDAELEPWHQKLAEVQAARDVRKKRLEELSTRLTELETIRKPTAQQQLRDCTEQLNKINSELHRLKV